MIRMNGGTDCAVHWLKNCKKYFRSQEEENSRTRIESTHLSRKQQDEISVLQEFHNFLVVDSEHSRTHWWEFTSVWVDGPRSYVNKNTCFIEDTRVMSCQSSLREDEKSKEGRQVIFFTPLNPFGYNPDEQEPSDDPSEPRKVQYHKWKNYRGRRLLDQFSPSAGQRTTILTSNI